MLQDYKVYILSLKSALEREGVELPEDMKFDDYKDIFFSSEVLNDIIWVFSIIGIGGSKASINDFPVPLDLYIGKVLRDQFYKEYIAERLDYTKISVSDEIVKNKIRILNTQKKLSKFFKENNIDPNEELDIYDDSSQGMYLEDEEQYEDNSNEGTYLDDEDEEWYSDDSEDSENIEDSENSEGTYLDDEVDEEDDGWYSSDEEEDEVDESDEDDENWYSPEDENWYSSDDNDEEDSTKYIDEDEDSIDEDDVDLFGENWGNAYDDDEEESEEQVDYDDDDELYNDNWGSAYDDEDEEEPSEESDYEDDDELYNDNWSNFYQDDEESEDELEESSEDDFSDELEESEKNWNSAYQDEEDEYDENTSSDVENKGTQQGITNEELQYSEKNIKNKNVENIGNKGTPKRNILRNTGDIDEIYKDFMENQDSYSDIAEDLEFGVKMSKIGNSILNKFRKG